MNTDQIIKAISPWMNYIRPVLILAGFLLFSLLLHFPHDWQHWSADLITSRFSTRSDSQNRDIVLVYISNDTLNRCSYRSRTPIPCNYTSPIDREFLYKLINTVDDAKPRVIGLDIILDRPTESRKDQMLQETLAKKTNAKIVLGVVSSPAPIQAEFMAIGKKKDSFSTGSVYLGEIQGSLVVADHVVRLWNPWFEEPKTPIPNAVPTRPTFAEALAHAAGRDYTPASPYIDWLLPPKTGSGIFSTFSAWLCPPQERLDPVSTISAWFCPSNKSKGPDTFLTLSAEDVLYPAEHANLPIADLLSGKVVLIGGNFDDRDQHLTPLSVSQDDFYPGVFIHAQILAQLLSRRSVYDVNGPILIGVSLAVGAAGFFLGRGSGHRQLWLELAIVVVLVVASMLSFIVLRFLIPCNLLLLVGLAGAALGHHGFPNDPKRRNIVAVIFNLRKL